MRSEVAGLRHFERDTLIAAGAERGERIRRGASIVIAGVGRPDQRGAGRKRSAPEYASELRIERSAMDDTGAVCSEPVHADEQTVVREFGRLCVVQVTPAAVRAFRAVYGMNQLDQFA